MGHEMKEITIAAKLLLGSAEIDRMRREIDQLISLLIGYLGKVHRRDLLPGRSTQLDRSGLCFNHGIETWIVGRIANGTNRPFIELEVSPHDGVRTVYYSEWGKTRVVEVDHVRGVHAALPRLVARLEREFPELSQYWVSLIEAADAALKQQGI